MIEPRATYRLQLGPHLDLAGAAELIPYIAALGVSHLYLSPIWQARAGSTHGYDVVDPAVVSAELGGEAALRSLSKRAREWDLGLICDFVPNHMAADAANRYWTDPELREKFFDIDRQTGHHRRFFDIDDLVGVRQEDPEVFAATHAKVIELAAERVISGLRIDHPDGLADPAGYLRRLRESGIERVWVEKILEPGESIRRNWICDGTTGYEFCVDVGSLFVNPDSEAALTDLWTEISADERPYSEWAAEAKREQAATTFAVDLDRLDAIHEVPGAREAVAMLSAYRTYVVPESGEVADEDRALAADLPEAVRRALLLEDREVPAEWVTRFQQITAPVVAKGVEDTAFYRYLRLTALNEVGGDPGRLGIEVGEFHAANAERLERFPYSMLTTATHDTKRSGDLRARIAAMTDVDETLLRAVRRWMASSESLFGDVRPTDPERWLIIQTLLAAWPIEWDRFSEYLVKAMREAKLETNWIEPNLEHEQAVLDYAEELYDYGPFRSTGDSWIAVLARAGARSALGQLLLKLTCPGIPDLYQGDELEFVALVDPDNRREIDWEVCQQALAALDANDEAAIREPVPPELFKLDMIRRVMDLRMRRPGAFAGDYTPIAASDDICAYMRGDDVIVAVRTRYYSGILKPAAPPSWALPASASGRWRDAITEQEHELPDGASLEELIGPEGRAVLERAG